jgi:hypothetical protein
LPVLVLKAGDLRGVASRIHEDRRAGSRKNDTVRRLKSGDLPFNLLDLSLQPASLFLKEADGQVGLVLDLVAVHSQKLGHIGLHHCLRLARIRVVVAHRDRDGAFLARPALSNVACQCSDRRRLPHLVDDIGHWLRSPLRRIEIVLLDQADEVAAAKDLFANLRDALLNLTSARSFDDIRRKILGLHEQRRRRPIERRKHEGRDQADEEHDDEWHDHVHPPLPENGGHVVDQPGTAAFRPLERSGLDHPRSPRR